MEKMQQVSRIYVKTSVLAYWRNKGLKVRDVIAALLTKVSGDSFATIALRLNEKEEVFILVISTTALFLDEDLDKTMAEEKWFSVSKENYGKDAIVFHNLGLGVTYTQAVETAVIYMNVYNNRGWKVINSDWNSEDMRRHLTLNFSTMVFNELNNMAIASGKRSIANVIRDFVYRYRKHKGCLRISKSDSNSGIVYPE